MTFRTTECIRLHYLISSQTQACGFPQLGKLGLREFLVLSSTKPGPQWVLIIQCSIYTGGPEAYTHFAGRGDYTVSGLMASPLWLLGGAAQDRVG